MNRIGIDLSVLNAPPSTEHVHPTCPGAVIRITADEYRAYVAQRMQFDEDNTDVPREGYGSARVRCSNLVQRVPQRKRRKDGTPIESIRVLYYGLCSVCSTIEQVNRDVLRRRVEGAAK